MYLYPSSNDNIIPLCFCGSSALPISWSCQPPWTQHHRAGTRKMDMLVQTIGMWSQACSNAREAGRGCWDSNESIGRTAWVHRVLPQHHHQPERAMAPPQVTLLLALQVWQSPDCRTTVDRLVYCWNCVHYCSFLTYIGVAGFVLFILGNTTFRYHLLVLDLSGLAPQKEGECQDWRQCWGMPFG